MTDAQPSPARAVHYRFLRPGGAEIETGDFPIDDAAVAHARTLSKSGDVPVIVRRYEGGDEWDYVTEVDERTSL